ncbi:MAG: hypothetical protein RR827_08165 [Oscillospiraceae bacterium]
MTTLQITSIQPLEGKHCNSYAGIAYDGHFFYFTLPSCCQVHRMNARLANIEYIDTCREYTSLCFDRALKCFWALAYHQPNKIFKLDRCLGEIDCLTVCSPCKKPVTLTGVSCKSGTNKLLISGSFGVAEVSKCESSTFCIVKRGCEGVRYTSVENLDVGYIYSAYNCSCECSMVNIGSYSGCENILRCCIPAEYEVEDMTAFHICCNGERAQGVYILATKHCSYSYLIKCAVLSGDCEVVPSPEPYPPCPPPAPCTPTCAQSSGQVIRSIALVEAALSHILNAEGEKIQKVLSCTDNPCEILRLNDSVNKTIINVTHLEQVLFSKLQVAQELCNGGCEKYKPCPPVKEEGCSHGFLPLEEDAPCLDNTVLKDLSLDSSTLSAAILDSVKLSDTPCENTLAQGSDTQSPSSSSQGEENLILDSPPSGCL